jgi:lipopolysaccharide transport system ATP-binding protein
MTFSSIEVLNLGKIYPLAEKRAVYKTIREEAVRFFKRRDSAITLRAKKAGTGDKFWALENVSFSVRRGEVLGIIGRNGAGKSTLLKILSRITDPTVGTAKIYGKVGSLLEVGTGFHGELSGRENVYLNGAILGMTKNEIDKKFDEIVTFAEVEKFIDLPVKHYSSGMSVRLAFSVAAHLDTDIMLIDEVLAVGDIGFQKKCTALLRSSIADGRTAILVSHTMGLIRTLCSRVILLESGNIYMDGTPDEVISSYYKLMLSSQGSYKADQARSTSFLHVSTAYLTDLNENPVTEIPCGKGFRIVLEFEGMQQAVVEKPKVHLKIHSTNGEYMTYLGSKIAGFDLPSIVTGSKIVCELADVNLAPGEYSIGFIIADGVKIYDEVASALSFTVTTADYFGSGVLPDGRYGRILLKSRWWAAESENLPLASISAIQNG